MESLRGTATKCIEIKNIRAVYLGEVTKPC